MMACCEFCYDKYINDDGSIDWTVLYPLQMKHPHVVVKEGTECPVCDCRCHRKDTKMLH